MDRETKVNAIIQERARQQQALKWNEFVSRYVLNLQFPAKVVSKVNPKTPNKQHLKTDGDLINARLLENGILFEDLQTLPQIQMGVAQVVDNLMRTGCYESVQVEIGEASATDTSSPVTAGSSEEQESKHELSVKLCEKNWYSLYIGGGIKQDGMNMEETLGSMGTMSTGNIGGAFPKVQFECSASFPNWTGYLDYTTLKYTIDQTSTSTLLLSHEKPLYAWIGDTTALGEFVLNTAKGSQYSLGLRAMLDTIDYEYTRSYKEYLRQIMWRLDNTGRIGQRTDMAPGYYWGIDWSLALKDMVPRKHSKLPYGADASHEIVALSGSTFSHSLSWEVRSNGEYCNDRFNPIAGLDWHSKIEVAGPPGDTGFAKAQAGSALHLPILGESLALHGSCAGGYMRHFSFGGFCRQPTISDRFFVGGPMQLRGFLPAGIGPRSLGTGGSTSPGGDALGGTMFYTATIAASITPPLSTTLQEFGVRLFGFANAGTLVGNPEGIPISTIVNSTRVAAGAGVSASTPMGRLELTYAWPLRYGPRDARRNLQFGFGFNFG